MPWRGGTREGRRSLSAWLGEGQVDKGAGELGDGPADARDCYAQRRERDMPAGDPIVAIVCSLTLWDTHRAPRMVVDALLKNKSNLT